MMFVVFVGGTMAFIVGCADSVAEETHRRISDRVLRAVLWPATLWTWFTHRNLPKLGRFAANVWLLVTGGWLLSLEADRLSTVPFLIVAEATMGFVVYCVDLMSAELRRNRARRLLRIVLWPKAIVDYLLDADSIRLIQASVTVWILLTSGWLLGLLADRIGQPFGWT